jgi:hypothetical protein
MCLLLHEGRLGGEVSGADVRGATYCLVFMVMAGRWSEAMASAAGSGDG